MQQSRAHHYLARSLQKRFCNANNKLWVFDKKSGSMRQQAPAVTAVQTDLYTIEDPNGKKHDLLERGVFAPADGKILELIRRVIHPEYRFFEPNDIVEMSYFLSLQNARVPRAIEFQKEFTKAVVQKILRDGASNKEDMDKRYANALTHIDNPSELTREKFQQMIEQMQDFYELKIKDEFALKISLQAAGILFETLLKIRRGLLWTPRKTGSLSPATLP